MEVLKIAVLSDSHHKPELFKEALEMLKNKGANYILHAGDLQIKENLDILKDANLPYVSVFGNNDYNLVQYQNDFRIYKEPHYFKIKDTSFKLMHLPYYLTGDTDVVISGHTHIFHCEYKNETLFLNPGETCAREKNLVECVFLEVSSDEYKVEYCFKEPLSNIWESKVYTFSR